MRRQRGKLEMNTDPLIVQYTKLLHKYRDPGAQPVWEFRQKHSGDQVFSRRAAMLDRLLVAFSLVPTKSKERSALMHYRNGRVANNGDKVIQLSSGGECKITGFGLLHDATPGNDYCNGSLAPLQPAMQGACLCDCLHVDDVVELLKNAGLGT